QWQSSVPDKPFTTGWGGRLADLVNAMNSNNQISMSISLNGANSFQRGNVVNQYAVNSSGVSSINSGSSTNGTSLARDNAIAAIMSGPQANLHAAAFGQVGANAIADATLLTSVFKQAPTLKTTFPATQTARRLAMVAKLMSVAPNLG